MNKYQYFLKALETDLIQDIQWIISLLSYTKYDSDSKDTPYLSLKYQDDQCLYYTEDGLWREIEGSYPQRGLFIYNEPFTLPGGILENSPNTIETTIGRIIQNKLLLCHPFKDKIAYINQRFGPGDIEKIIKPRLVDDDDPKQKPSDIPVSEYLKYCNAALFISQLTQVCTPGTTEKSLLPPPNAKEVLNQLIEKHKDHLDNPAVIAEIGKEMEQLDREYLKGDRSMGFLIKGKDFDVVRKKMFLMYGFDRDFEDKTSTVDFNPRPLCDGIDYSKLTSYINGSRIGSFSRGAETQLGGVAVKELLRTSSNASIAIEDCGTTLGIPTTITQASSKTYLGFYYIENKQSILITEDNISSLIGRTVSMRSPAYCKASHTDYCSKCVGPVLSLHQHGISSAVSAMGSVFLNTFMKAMHGKPLIKKELNFDELIS